MILNGHFASNSVLRRYVWILWSLAFEATLKEQLRHRAVSLRQHGFLVCVGLRKTHLFCNRLRIGRSRSSKVVDFGTNRKGVCDFLLVIYITLVLSFTFSEIRRVIGWIGVNPFEFLDDFFIPKTRVPGLSVGEDFVILACVVFTQYQHVTDRRISGS